MANFWPGEQMYAKKNEQNIFFKILQSTITFTESSWENLDPSQVHSFCVVPWKNSKSVKVFLKNHHVMSYH